MKLGPSLNRRSFPAAIIVGGVRVSSILNFSKDKWFSKEQLVLIGININLY